jgi:hypothetical protein
MFKVGDLFVSTVDKVKYLILSSDNDETKFLVYGITKFLVYGITNFQKYFLIQTCDNSNIALKTNKERYKQI